MTTHCTAVYEGGVLRPTGPIALAEGARVEVIIVQTHDAAPRNPADILAAIAALPTAAGDPFTSRDHDQILYGGLEAR